MVSAKSPTEKKPADLPQPSAPAAWQEGDPAPDFSAQTSDGKQASLSDFHGKFLVLYFYPRDSTPGCTREACGFRDQFSELRRNGIEVLGVSADSAASHRKFREKQRLPFELLVDEQKEVIGRYQAWGQKSFLGRKYFGVLRITFLIGPDGRIARIWPKVKPEEHAAEILAAVKEIKNKT